jgi:hypothetical protein
MPSRFNSFKYAFLGTVLAVVTLLAAYQLFYAIPQKKCEAAGDWWSFRYRECAHPMRIVDLPGMKPKAATAAAASASPAAAVAPAASASAAGHP